MIKGSESVILSATEYAELVNRNSQLEEVNDALNERNTELVQDIVSLKAQTGQGLNFIDLRDKVLPYVKYTELDLSNKDSMSAEARNLLNNAPDVIKWMESLK